MEKLIAKIKEDLKISRSQLEEVLQPMPQKLQENILNGFDKKFNEIINDEEEFIEFTSHAVILKYSELIQNAIEAMLKNHPNKLVGLLLGLLEQSDDIKVIQKELTPDQFEELKKHGIIPDESTDNNKSGKVQ